MARLAAVPALVEEVKTEDDEPARYRSVSPKPAAGRLDSLESIRPGAVVRSVNGETVTDFESLRAALWRATDAASEFEEGVLVVLELETFRPTRCDRCTVWAGRSRVWTRRSERLRCSCGRIRRWAR